MLFRSTSRHTMCSVCVRHKLLLKVLSNDVRSYIKQQHLYTRHLRAQYMDRAMYWNARSDSRLAFQCQSSFKVVVICDGMDQSKFCWPRGGWFAAHEFDFANRPRLHFLCAIAHGWGLYFGLSHFDAAKGSSNTVDFLAFVLTDLYRQGCRLSECELHLQLDNAASSNKNNAMLLWGGGLVHSRLVKRFSACFLRAGHTHEDVDQVFGDAAKYIRKNLHNASTIYDFRDGMQKFANLLVRPEKHRRVIIHEKIRDWKGYLYNIPKRVTGISGPTAPRVFNMLRRGGLVGECQQNLVTCNENFMVQYRTFPLVLGMVLFKDSSV